MSGAAIEVLATELYGDARLSRDETIARFTEGVGDASPSTSRTTGSRPTPRARRRSTPTSSVPCSMGTLGTIASGAMQNLIHRAASVALKEERKLVLCPRETPLSAIHLENMLTLRRAGATILFLAPGFYHGAETVDDLVDFVVARMLDQLGLANSLVATLGAAHDARAGRGAHDVRPDRAGLRRDEPGDDASGSTCAGAGWPPRRSCGPATGCSTPPAAPAISRSPTEGRCGARHRTRLLGADARARAAARRRARVGAGRHARAAVRRRRRSTRRPSASASATSPISSSHCASCGASCGPADGSRSSRSRSRAAC